MSVDIKSLLLKKNAERTSTNRMVMKDVNRDLIVALLAIPVYGKEARDEEILSIIINAGVAEVSDSLTKIRENYDKMLKDKKIKKDKNGNTVDTDGFMVLVPR